MGKTENVCDMCEVSELWLSCTIQLREPVFQGRWADGRKDCVPGHSFILQTRTECTEMRDRLCAADAQRAGRFLLTGGAGARTETTQRWHQPDLEQVTQSQGRM